MTLDSAETFIGQTGHIYWAPTGTDFPASVGEAIDTDDWTELGYVDTDGVQFTDTPSFQAIRSWQKRKPIRMLKGDIEATVGFNVQQWNNDTLLLAFGGGDVTEDEAGEFTYHPPSEEEVVERALIIEGFDGDVVTRLCIARALNQAATTFSWNRTAEAKLPMEFMVMAADDETDDWFIQSNAPGFAATGS